MCTRTNKYQEFLVVLQTDSIKTHADLKSTDKLILKEDLNSWSIYDDLHDAAIVDGMFTYNGMKNTWLFCLWGCSGCQRMAVGQKGIGCLFCITCDYIFLVYIRNLFLRRHMLHWADL